MNQLYKQAVTKTYVPAEMGAYPKVSRADMVWCFKLSGGSAPHKVMRRQLQHVAGYTQPKKGMSPFSEAS